MLKKLIPALALTLSFAAQAEDSHGHVVNFDDAAWSQIGEGVEEAVLWGSEEAGDAMWAFRMQPGVEFPLHAHSNDYHGIAIQGNWTHIDAEGNEATHGQDAFAFVKGGDFHGDRCAGPEVCITLVDLDGKRDMYFQ
ncbi:MAG: hypothetical protein HWE20_11695 [Gammaproteobacteria bacterium]|nr:hypothetical protein [Gammaproteobacteria bacterium]